MLLVWAELDPPERNLFFKTRINIWLKKYSTWISDQINQAPWKMVFIFASWSIWLVRNKLIFQQDQTINQTIFQISNLAMKFIYFIYREFLDIAINLDKMVSS